jgi:pectinesterase
LVVAAEGGGDYRTVQEAVDAVPAGNRERFVIRIRPGVYKERIVVPKGKPFVSFEGEDAGKTILTFDLNARSRGPDGREIGTFNTASTTIQAADFSALGVTFENAFGVGAQALAISVGGDRAAFRRCRFLGWQDTILTHGGRQYYEDCYIAGHVDFIFGGATAFFKDCEIHCRGNGYITAASTPETEPFGYVFAHCRITAEPGVSKVYLGRPWRPFAGVTFIDTTICGAVVPEGWHNWGEPSREKTARYAEFQSTGPGASPGSRVGWSRQLTADQAAAITPEAVLGGRDGWAPGSAFAVSSDRPAD